MLLVHAPSSPTIRSSVLAARGQVLHEGGGAEGPGRDLVAVVHHVHQRAELAGADGDDVARLVGEALAGAVAVLQRREHGAEEQHQARSEEHTSELQSLMRISYAVFGLKNKNTTHK